MPIRSCQRDGRPGFQFGPTGKCFTYEGGNERARTEAHNKAAEQGRAIEASKRER